jgi:hypothetical protein
MVDEYRLATSVLCDEREVANYPLDRLLNRNSGIESCPSPKQFFAAFPSQKDSRMTLTKVCTPYPKNMSAIFINQDLIPLVRLLTSIC